MPSRFIQVAVSGRIVPFNGWIVFRCTHVTPLSRDVIGSSVHVMDGDSKDVIGGVIRMLLNSRR